MDIPKLGVLKCDFQKKHFWVGNKSIFVYWLIIWCPFICSFNLSTIVMHLGKLSPFYAPYSSSCSQ